MQKNVEFIWWFQKKVVILQSLSWYDVFLTRGMV